MKQTTLKRRESAFTAVPAENDRRGHRFLAALAGSAPAFSPACPDEYRSIFEDPSTPPRSSTRNAGFPSEPVGGMRGAYLRRIDLRGADLRGAHLAGAVLDRKDLTGAVLETADLADASLFEANLSGANLISASLVGANLRGASLHLANLRGAYLENAALPGADLRAADLREANLAGADMAMADLHGADLSGAVCPARSSATRTWAPTSTARTCVMRISGTRACRIRKRSRPRAGRIEPSGTWMSSRYAPARSGNPTVTTS